MAADAAGAAGEASAGEGGGGVEQQELAAGLHVLVHGVNDGCREEGEDGEHGMSIKRASALQL